MSDATASSGAYSLDAPLADITAAVNNTNNQQHHLDLTTIYALQSELHAQIDTVQSNTTKLLVQHQTDLLHEFQVKISELNEQLQAEKQLNQHGSIHWIELSNKLKAENAALTSTVSELRSKLSHKNSENEQLTANLKRLQSDHTFMVNQVHQYKQYIAELQVQLREREERINETCN